ncbi:MAG: 4Fe-4S ferredoxin iron-sulfur binding domain-containing protein [Spirochaetes bacterium]|nr:MAG: 4Fe-4S ferredoxin iron-sulfur binding domain-containing protein [Spirochaetota bacterium]
MAHKITEACINCAACESECPVNAISEKNDARWIDPDLCIDCGNCVSVCPTNAILAG